MSAVFSPGREWRYTLTRENIIGLDRLRVPPMADVTVRTVAFIGLNPSTADETTDDATVRRCVGFAKRWGFDRLVMLNIFALRSTDPRALYRHEDPVGPKNDFFLGFETEMADLIVCAWGARGALHGRGLAVRDVLTMLGKPLYHLGLTKDGHPKHPLYLKGDLEPTRWVQ